MEIRADHNKQETVRKILAGWLKSAEVGERLVPERQLAASIGVSRPTVRKAVDELVKEGLLRRVQGSGVYVNKSLSQRARQICVIYHRSTDQYVHINSFLFTIWHHLEVQVNARGWVLVAASPDESGQLPPIVAESDGVILFHRSSAGNVPSHLPKVVTFDAGYSVDATFVLIDDYLGGRSAADHLYSLGHQRLAFFGDVGYYWTSERYRGVRDRALESDKPEPLLMSVDLTRPSVAPVVDRLREFDITGVVCANDSQAMSLISALHRNAIRVPEDMSVTGFDDVPSAARFEPPLTTIKLPVEEAAAIAVSELAEQIETGNAGPCKRIILPAELVIRDSCMPPRR